MKMFKIDKPEMVNRTFRLPKDLVEDLGRVAQEQGVSTTQLVIQCCRYALGSLEKGDDSSAK